MVGMTNPDITYSFDISNVDWSWLKQRLQEDKFCNGRTPEQYQTSFENSYAVVLAMHNNEIVGKARVLSDGICNAYIVDVWTYTPFRHQGIASAMLQKLEEKLTGQHVYLTTDDAMLLYEKNGFKRQDVGMGKVVGRWLQNG